MSNCRFFLQRKLERALGWANEMGSVCVCVGEVRGGGGLWVVCSIMNETDADHKNMTTTDSVVICIVTNTDDGSQ